MSAIRRTLREPAEEVRQLEVARLDRMMRSLWERVLKGDAVAINACLSIMDRRARYLGLDTPQKHALNAHVAVEYEGEDPREMLKRKLEQIAERVKEMKEREESEA